MTRFAIISIEHVYLKIQERQDKDSQQTFCFQYTGNASLRTFMLEIIEIISAKQK